MNAQQKYRLLYIGKLITLIPLLGICLVAIPIYWVITGKFAFDWLLDEYIKYKEPKKPKKPTQAIVGDNQGPESWRTHNRLPDWVDTSNFPPPKPIPPQKPNTTTDNTDQYEY